MRSLIGNITENLMSIEMIIIIILLLGGLIFFSRDFKIGALVNFIIFSGTFVLFYEMDLNFRLPLMISVSFLVMLALSLYLVKKTTATGGFVS